MSDLDFIKQFSKITITKACKEYKVDISNLLNDRVSKDKITKIRKYLESEVAKLYIIGDENGEYSTI